MHAEELGGEAEACVLQGARKESAVEKIRGAQEVTRGEVTAKLKCLGSYRLHGTENQTSVARWFKAEWNLGRAERQRRGRHQTFRAWRLAQIHFFFGSVRRHQLILAGAVGRAETRDSQGLIPMPGFQP